MFSLECKINDYKENINIKIEIAPAMAFFNPYYTQLMKVMTDQSVS